MKFENIIFLDFDGVIITPESRWNHLDPTCMFHLKRVIEECDAWIVITSTHRKLKSLIELKEFFNEEGFPEVTERIIGVTDDLKKSMCRGEEIEKWIEDNKSWNRLDLKSFVIIDDDSADMGKFKETHLVKTYCYDGMKKEDADKAINILKERR